MPAAVVTLEPRAGLTDKPVELPIALLRGIVLVGPAAIGGVVAVAVVVV
jgi:hypothetical protein